MLEPNEPVSCQHCGNDYPYKDIENPELHKCAKLYAEDIEERRQQRGSTNSNVTDA